MQLFQSLIRTVSAQVKKVAVDPLSTLFGAKTSLANVFSVIINVTIGVGVALTIVYLVIGGIGYVTSQGDRDKTEEARKSLTNAVIGFVVVLAAVTIRFAIANVLDADVSKSGLNTVTPF